MENSDDTDDHVFARKEKNATTKLPISLNDKNNTGPNDITVSMGNIVVWSPSCRWITRSHPVTWDSIKLL